MANDTEKAVSSNDVRNGTLVVNTGSEDGSNFKKSTENTIVGDITDTQTKYDARLDDPRYYTGDTAS